MAPCKDAELYRKYLQLDADWLDSFKSEGELAESKVDSAYGNASFGARVDKIWNISNIPSEKTRLTLIELHGRYWLRWTKY